ncbi:MAG: tetratricopeptide repeat protein [Proteobacteria bacterium]|nr:tetratricopeptide repeat protein [Pseudomonadota bacterium]NIS72539.1 tetratricopeptide repeat protein [Pseudomonadota bacterium]
MPKKLKRTGKSKPTKRTIEIEPSISAIDRTTTFFTENWRLFVVVFVLLGMVATVVVLWMRRAEQMELRASFLLSQGVAKLKEADGLSGEEADKAYNGALEVFQNLVSDYGATESGELGVFYMAKSLSRLQRYGEAAQQYERFLFSARTDPLYRSLALRSLGFAYQHEKDYEKALASLDELEEMEGGFLTGDSMLARAQLYEEMGKMQEALELYREFLKEHPDSTESSRVQRRVAFLEKKLQ